MAVLTNEGRLWFLNAIGQNRTPDTRVHLYTAYTGGPNAEGAGVGLANLVEADFEGYGYLGVGLFNAPTINGAGEGEMTSNAFVFTAAGITDPQTIIGLYVTHWNGNGNPRSLIWLHQFANTITLVNDGEEVRKLVNIFDDNLVPA